MTVDLSSTGLAKLQQRHRKVRLCVGSSWTPTDVCLEDSTPWPCESSQLAAELVRLRAEHNPTEAVIEYGSEMVCLEGPGPIFWCDEYHVSAKYQRLVYRCPTVPVQHPTDKKDQE